MHLGGCQNYGPVLGPLIRDPNFANYPFGFRFWSGFSIGYGFGFRAWYASEFITLNHKP